MRPLLILPLLLLSLALAGCAAAQPEAGQDAAATGGGMGMGGSAEGGVGMLGGAVASSDNASITLGPNAAGGSGVTVSKVLAPADGWVVVRSSNAPGPVLGKTWVPKGPSSDVVVKLDAADTADVRVALHVDQGAKRQFEFDPARAELSLDKPVVVDGRPLEERIALTGFGAEVLGNSVLMLVEDQAVKDGTITVRYLLLPQPGWISVNTVENGLPGERVGLQFRPAGESQEVVVPVAGAVPGEHFVTVHTDSGQAAASSSPLRARWARPTSHSRPPASSSPSGSRCASPGTGRGSARPRDSGMRELGLP